MSDGHRHGPEHHGHPPGPGPAHRSDGPDRTHPNDHDHGHGHDHGHDHGHHHDGVWIGDGGVETVELTTVGIDVGSSTSHAVFARLRLRRQAQALSSRYAVVGRETLARSPIVLTPYRADGLIDAERVERFIAEAYHAAGIDPEQVDSGAVILTGVALERPNAQPLTTLLAGAGGRFVCASAGHHLEATLAAHGSGAVANSRGLDGPALHIDIGGGTSKLSLIRSGEIVATAAVRVGARLVELDQAGAVIRVEDAACRLAEDLGVRLRIGEPLAEPARRALAERMAEVLAEVALAGPLSPLAAALMATEPLPQHRDRSAGSVPVPVTLSGGVAEYVYGRVRDRFGDLGVELAAAVRDRLGRLFRLGADPGTEVIRATVIGAAQFTVQLSGSTVHVSREAVLPLRNVPVVRVGTVDALPAALDRLDLGAPDRSVAVALPRPAEPSYRALRQLAEGIAAGLPGAATGRAPVVLAVGGDLGLSLGRILVDEVGIAADVVALDEVELHELDFVDIGAVVRPAGVVPVVVKSLVFPHPAARHAVAHPAGDQAGSHPTTPHAGPHRGADPAGSRP